MIKYFYIQICLMLLLVCMPTLSANELLFEHEARAWSKKIIKQYISYEEFTLLLNLLYFSTQRSAEIITMQHAVARYVAATGSVLNDAIGSRRNPAKITSITGYQTSQWDTKVQTFDEAHARVRMVLERYHAHAAAYAHCLEHLIKNDGLSSELLACVEQLREEARCAMIVRMQAQASSLQNIKDTLKKIMRTFSAESRAWEDDMGECITRGIIDCLANFAAPAAIASYVKLDQKYNQFNDAVWRSLIMGYEVDNLLWDILEQVRVDFYRTYYTTLVQIAREQGIFQEPIFVAFDADGFIMPDIRTDFLPLSV